jgi:Tol biopolymer transport system component
MRLAVGTTLGPYEIVAPLGAGGIGEVYRARDTRLGRDVALKISAGPFSERFEREARAIAALNHPRVCQIYDVGPDYLVMELIDGKPLTAPLSSEMAIECGLQILDGLDAAHRKGIVHRDLKPANILVTKSGIKLLDFGLAAIAETDADSDATRTLDLTGPNTVVGTLPYMSPEQVQAKRVDTRSDLFSFGLVLYEVLTGTRAFQGDSRASLIASILKDEPAPVSALTRGAIPPALDAVVRACLAKDPDDRWQTARDLKRELLRIASEGGKPARSPQAAPRHRRLWVALLALAGIALIALGGQYLRRTAAAAPLVASLLSPGDGVNFVFDPNAGGAAFSPDGRSLVFGGEFNGKYSLYLRDMETGEMRAIPYTENGGKPFWSPAGRSLVFSAAGHLKRLDLAGGEPVNLALGGNRGITCNRNGVVLFSSNANAGLPSGIWRVSADGGPPARVTTVDESAGENAHYWPQFLPDGVHFLYLVRGATREKNALFVGSLNDGPVQPKRARILQCSYRAQYAPSATGGDGYLLFLDGSALFAQRFSSNSLALKGERVALAQDVNAIDTNGYAAFAVSADGKLVYGTGVRQLQQLAWRDRAGNIRLTAVDPAAILDVALSPDAANALVLLMNPSNGKTEIYSADLVRGSKTLISSAPAGFFTAIWSPDGKEVAYAAPQGLFRTGFPGLGTPQRVGDAFTPMSWSPDGQFLLGGDADQTGKGSIWVLPLMGAAKPYLYMSSEARMYNARFSPDGRWMVYNSDESGAREVYLQSFPPGRGKWQISVVVVGLPLWRNDGRELYYMAGNSGGTGNVMAVSLTIAGDRVTASTPQFLFECPRSAGYSIAVTDNGRRFLVLERVKATPKPLTLLLNWQTKLRT